MLPGGTFRDRIHTHPAPGTNAQGESTDDLEAVVANRCAREHRRGTGSHLLKKGIEA